MRWRFALLACLAAGAAAAGETGSGGGNGAAPPKKPPLPETSDGLAKAKGPALVPSLRQRFSSLAMAKTLVGTLHTVQPYLRNPLRIPPHLGAAVGLFLLSVYYLINTMTSVLKFISNPGAVALNLCIASGLHYASLIALRGWSAQLASMGRCIDPERATCIDRYIVNLCSYVYIECNTIHERTSRPARGDGPVRDAVSTMPI